jgi:hypothetical protein
VVERPQPDGGGVREPREVERPTVHPHEQVGTLHQAVQRHQVGVLTVRQVPAAPVPQPRAPVVPIAYHEAAQLQQLGVQRGQGRWVQVLALGGRVAHRVQEDDGPGQLVQEPVRRVVLVPHLVLQGQLDGAKFVPQARDRADAGQGRLGRVVARFVAAPVVYAVVRLAVRRRQPGVVCVGVAYDMRARRPERGRLARGTPDADLVATPRPRRQHVGDVTGIAEAVGKVYADHCNRPAAASFMPFLTAVQRQPAQRRLHLLRACLPVALRARVGRIEIHRIRPARRSSQPFVTVALDHFDRQELPFIPVSRV